MPPLPLLVTLCLLANPGEAQNLRDLARAHGAQNPGVALHLTGPPGDYRPKAIEALAKESNVVLRGRLARIRTYLGPNEDRVLTDYQMHVDRLIAGNLPLPTATRPGGTPSPILTVYGGELTVEGVLLRATDPTRDGIAESSSYLLFLMPSRSGQPGSYEIYHGGIFDVSDGSVRPLLKHGDRVFPSTAGSALEDLIRKIETTVK